MSYITKGTVGGSECNSCGGCIVCVACGPSPMIGLALIGAAFIINATPNPW
ncbi:hypothetical protein KAU34_01675 [candidate division WOR-3 bacterium]|nr:hypothetical protein [candidate division WOR-3 bacterium]MCK4575097.1 hypothetical protein [candidate division WOR-3 bacterium]